MDNLLPSFLRDNKYFMYPMFFLWYKGKNVRKLMEFKSNFHTLTEEEFLNYYRIYDSLPTRETDLMEKSIEFILKHIENDKAQKIIDIGCGNGYLLKRLKEQGYTNLSGLDICTYFTDDTIAQYTGNIDALPFPDKHFDTVLCNHTLEHVLNLSKAISELKRITKKKLIITLPCQRYNRYTFELHIHFFPQASYLLNSLNNDNGKKITRYECKKIQGDWSYIGYLKEEEK
jgi:ubiquinone/menaquinone biosynthesis C-methylase UbiE